MTTAGKEHTLPPYIHDTGNPARTSQAGFTFRDVGRGRA